MFVIFLLCAFTIAIADDSNKTIPIEECPVKMIYPDSPLTRAGFTPNSNEDIWLKPGNNFKKIAFQIWKDRIFDFQKSIPDSTRLQFTRELLNLDESSINKWIHIRFLITLNEQPGIDTFVMRAFANGRSIYKDTGLWWRTVDIKKIEILVEGEAEVAIDCRPKSVQIEMFEHAALKSDPFKYAFWGLFAMLILLAITVSVVILKYCKAKVRKQIFTLNGKENSNSMRHYTCEDDSRYDMDEHIYDQPEAFKYLNKFNQNSKCDSGEYENEYVLENVHEVSLNVPKLTEESIYVQMDLFKK